MVARGIAYIATGIGRGTNNDAEWLALLAALGVAASLGERDIVLLGDAMFVVDRARAAGRGALPCGQAADYARRADGFDRVRIRHVRRAQNLAGIALERLHGRL